MKPNRFVVLIAGLVLAGSLLAVSQAQNFGAEVVEDEPITEVTKEELLREIQFTQATLFLATNDAALKLWYENRLDAIIKRYVPVDQHPAIGREIIALQGEVHELHRGLTLALYSALVESQIKDPDMLLGAASMNFFQLYEDAGLLIEGLHDMTREGEGHEGQSF